MIYFISLPWHGLRDNIAVLLVICDKLRWFKETEVWNLDMEIYINHRTSSISGIVIKK